MKRTGLTFIELIISITIFTIVIVAVYGVFYMGMKTWRRGQEQESLQEIRLALLKMEKEMKKAFFFSDIRFKGTSDKITFPLVIHGELQDELYTVTYSVSEDQDSRLKRILRNEKDMAGKEKSRKITPLMKSIKFEYRYGSIGPFEDFEWLQSWDGEKEDNLPSGVRISLETEQEIFNKVVFLKPEGFN